MKTLYLVLITSLLTQMTFAQDNIKESDKFGCKMNINPMQTEMVAGQKRAYNFLDCYDAFFQINYTPSQVICINKISKSTLEIVEEVNLKTKEKHCILEDVIKLNNKLYAIMSYQKDDITFLVYRKIMEDGTVGNETIIEQFNVELQGDLYISGALLTTNFDFFNTAYSSDSSSVVFNARVMYDKKENHKFAFVVIDEELNVLNSEIIESKIGHIGIYKVLLQTNGTVLLQGYPKEKQSFELLKVDFNNKEIDYVQTGLSEYNVHVMDVVEYDGFIYLVGLSKVGESRIPTKCFVIELTDKLDVFETNEYEFHEETHSISGDPIDMNDFMYNKGFVTAYFNEVGNLRLIYEARRSTSTTKIINGKYYPYDYYYRSSLLILKFKENVLDHGIAVDRGEFKVPNPGLKSFANYEDGEDHVFVYYDFNNWYIVTLDNHGDIKDRKVNEITKKSILYEKHLRRIHFDDEKFYLSTQKRVYSCKYR